MQVWGLKSTFLESRKITIQKRELIIEEVHIASKSADLSSVFNAFGPLYCAQFFSRQYVMTSDL